MTSDAVETDAPTGALLTGLRVLDCSHGYAGRLTASLLADHGAEVTRVDTIDGTSSVSAVGRAVGDRQKRSIRIDLHQPAGVELVRRLAERADVFVESWRPGVAEAIGVGAATLMESNPRLVYCSVSGYGQVGPDRDRPGWESLVQARVGMMDSQAGHRDGPIYGATPVATVGAAMLAIGGIAAALYEREVSGLGQVVDTSMLDGALSFVAMYWMVGERSPAVTGTWPTRRIIVKSFECADGEWIGVHTGAHGAHGRCMDVLGLGSVVAPARGPHETMEPLSQAEADLLVVELPRVFARRPRAEWLLLLTEADVCCAPVLRPGQLFDEPQVHAIGMAAFVDDPELGPLTQAGVAARVDRITRPVRPAPRPGQHTWAELVSLGLADDAIDDLRRRQVVS